MVRAAIALILSLLLPSALHAEPRIALLIGNKGYIQTVGPLKNPHNDIDLVGNALKQIGFEVMPPLRDGSRDQILLAVHDFAIKLRDAGPDAIGFLYYSGHGVALGGQNYLIPVDVSEMSTRVLSVKGITHTEILNKLQETAPQAAHYLVVDACRNNLGGWRGGKGFVPEQQRSGVLIAFAAAPGSVASDDGVPGGPYATALAAELVNPGQNDLLMFHKVRVAVDEKTGGDQVPWIEDGIRRRARVVFGGATQPIRARNEAREGWETLRGTNSVDLLEMFIKRFKDTSYGTLAQERIEELKKQHATLVTPPNSLHPATVARPTAANTDLPVRRCGGVVLDIGIGNERQCIVPGSGKTSWFKDCTSCPEMVIVPQGRFLMGSPENEPERFKKFEDQVQVTIQTPFAVGRFAVTFAEWDACVADGGCNGYKLSDQGWGRDRRPVINASWEDAKAYTTWISNKTGKTYRLLSEAEREYASRAGTTGPFWWGSSITSNQANYGATSAYLGGGSIGEYRKRTVPVDSFEPNPWGLYNVHGNVADWTEDCWNESNNGNPGDGRARESGDCMKHVARGGSWSFRATGVRAAYRTKYGAIARGNLVGFRVARTLH